MQYLVYFFFFFSSRRRHTRLQGDWSSDVCSSDLFDVAEAIAHSALNRQESRGAHQRTDFPARDDARFLAHSLVHRGADGSCRVEYLPVTITRWPPGERVYGR